MSTPERRVMVGVFQNKAQAQRAINDLRNVGITDDHIGVAMRENGWMAQCALDDLVNYGIPKDEVNRYKCEFEDGRIVVAVKFNCSNEEMFNFLISNSGPEQLSIHINGLASSPDETRIGSIEHLPDSQGIPSDNLRSQEAGSTEDDEMTSLRKLLKDAGFDHLL